MSYTKDFLDATKQSFMVPLYVWKTLLYDVGFYAALLLIFLLSNLFLLPQVKNAKDTLTSGSLAELGHAQAVAQQMFGLLAMIIGTVVIGIAIALVVFGFMKGLIWFTLAGERFTAQAFKKYMLASTPLLVIEFAVIGGLAALVGAKAAILGAILMPLFTHVHWFISYHMTHYKKVRKSWQWGLYDAIAQLVPFIPAYIVIWGVIQLISFMLQLFYIPAAQMFLGVLSGALIIVWLAWARYYFFTLAEKRLQ